MRYLTQLFTLTILAAATAVAQNSAPPSEQELAQLRRMEPQRAEEGLQYLTTTRERYGLDSRHTFRHINSATDSYGVFHGRYRQYFNGVRVVGGNAIVHIGRNGQMEKPTTKLYGSLTIPTVPAISERDAIVKALAAVNPGNRLTGMETSAVELIIHLETSMADRGEVSAGQLASNPRYRRYEEVVRSYHLAWQVMVSSDGSEFEPRILLIDANSGVVLKSMDAADNEAVNATGKGFFTGPRNFRTISQDGTFKAVDPDRGEDGNVFLNANHTAHTSHKKYSAYTDANNQWGNGKFDDGTNSTSSETAKSAITDAHFALGKAWDLLGTFGRNGWDNKGSRLYVRMHYGADYTDAKFQTGGLSKNEGMFLGDGGISTALRTIGHEFAHGFFHSIFGWTYKPNQEWAGINEGNSDVFGTLSELYTYKAPGENNRFTDMEGEWRWHARMINPSSYSPPKEKDTKGYTYWEPGLGNKEEHNVGCLYGHVFIFLADGASNDVNSPLYSKYLPNGLSGIGVEKAAFYWSRAMIHYFPEKGDYFDLRDAFLDAADGPYLVASDVAAIRSAFAGIGVGGAGATQTDTQAPQIYSADISRIDEAAGFLEVQVSAGDLNMARVEVLVDNKLAFTDFRPPYGGPVNLIGLTPGTHSITIRAYDIYGRASSTVRNFVLNGVRNLIVNGGFEEAGSWVGGGSAIKAGVDLAFAGKQYARMFSNAEIWQDVNIPLNATNVRLLYRVRAENHAESGFVDSELEVRLLNSSGNSVIQQVAIHKEGVETFENALTKTYKQMTVAIAHRGAARVSFKMSGGINSHRFKIDNVALVYELPVSASVKALVRDGEGSVEFTTSLNGLDPASVSHVSYYLDDAYANAGKPVASGYAPDYGVIVSTAGLSKKQHAVIASIRFKNGTEAAKAGVYFNVGSVNNLISNGDFENGYQNWPVTGGTLMLGPQLDTPNPCFLGFHCAVLGAQPGFSKTTAEQNLVMPLLVQSAKLTYRLRVNTAEPNPTLQYDTFRVYLVDASNKKWQIGKTYSNATQTNGWVLVEEDLPGGLLQPGKLHLVIESLQNNVNRTDFVIDNVSLVVKQLGIQVP